MKTRLECRTERLMQQSACPSCGSHKTASFREGASSQDRFSPDDKAGIRFYCGAEISIGKNGDMIGRAPCAFAMSRLIDDMELEADDGFERQEKAA